MLNEIAHYGLLGGLAIALLVAIATDLKSRRIYNWLTLTIAAGAPLFWFTSGLALWPEVAIQIAAAAGVFATCYLFFALGQMGGGDVKLLAALALWIPFDMLPALIVVMAIVGWLLTMGMAAWRVRASSGSALSRDMIVLCICFAIAVMLGAMLVGAIGMPEFLTHWGTSGLGAALAVALVPSLVLIAATVLSLKVIKRHARSIQVPYGLAIAIAGLWIIGSNVVSYAGAPAGSAASTAASAAASAAV